jgi:hypothetical protein
MEAILIMALKTFGPAACLAFVVAWLFYTVKDIQKEISTLKHDHDGCVERHSSVMELIEKHQDENRKEFAISSECKIIVNNFDEKFERIEKRFDKSDEKTDKIIELLMERKAQ